MLIEGYIYSLDSGLNLKDLKSGNYNAEMYDTERLDTWMNEKGISSWVVGKDAHFKFDTIISKPYIIYTQGDISLLNQSLLSIVGPRIPSLYQIQVIQEYFVEIRKHYVVTISGGAPGIDTMCHEMSLESGIPTIIVLGAGFQYYLSSKYRHLLKKVIESGGLVISEFRLGEKPSHWTYPQRNRIIAGLADVVFLPGAGEKSGSLITVDFALKMHKDVLSVPASIYEESSIGTNSYMKAGKIEVLCEIEGSLGKYFQKREKEIGKPALNFSKIERKIIECVKNRGSCSVHEICSLCKIDLGDIFVLLIELQIKGVISEDDTGYRTMIEAG